MKPFSTFLGGRLRWPIAQFWFTLAAMATHVAGATTNGYITAAADNDFKNNGQPVSNLTVSVAGVCGCDNSGTITATDCTSGICPAGQNKVVSLQVTCVGNFTSLFNYPGIPQTFTVTRSAIMRIGT